MLCGRNNFRFVRFVGFVILVSWIVFHSLLLMNCSVEAVTAWSVNFDPGL